MKFKFIIVSRVREMFCFFVTFVGDVDGNMLRVCCVIFGMIFIVVDVLLVFLSIFDFFVLLVRLSVNRAYVMDCVIIRTRLMLMFFLFVNVCVVLF